MTEPCDCDKTFDGYHVLCKRHWNEMMLRHELDEALRWAKHGRLDPEEWSDRQVLRFFDQLCYWAAKAATEAGGVVGSRR
jgi:hypothetical protein